MEGLLFLSAGLHFLPFESEPRIYLAAPSGVLVTQVTAVDPRHPTSTPEYRLHTEGQGGGDSQYFMIHAGSGNITTKRYIDRPVGSMYSFIVVAFSRGESEYQQVNIRVTEYNRYSPVFDSKHYKISLDVLTPVNKTFLTVHATDQDVQLYNAEIRYSILTRNNLLDVNQTTGELMLLSSLSPRYSDLVFTLLARDGGSPRRVARTKLTILVKIISAPTEISVEKMGNNLALICWLRPSSGRPSGYVIALTLKGDEETSLVKEVTKNVTINQLKEAGRPGRYCEVLSGLQPWKDYQAQVVGWNKEEAGIVSSSFEFHTRENRTCHLVNGTTPSCSCLAGFYGENCSLFNPCLGPTSPCQNGATCFSNGSNAFTCSCGQGYYGAVCERYNPCFLNPCQHGLCSNLSTAEYICTCNAGFTGTNCDININECASSPCLNDGTCRDGVDSYFCECPVGFAGISCEVNIDECNSSPCLNDGVCENEIGRFSCRCPLGFEGERCEKQINECTSNPCENDGICVDAKDTFECICKDGFEGDYCEEEINECSSLPCFNGGTCADAFNDYVCHCSVGFTGKNCQTDVDLCASNPCQNGGSCIDVTDHIVCHCVSGFTGTLCRDKVTCPAQIVKSERGVFAWQPVEHGTITRMECPYGTDTSRKEDKDSIYSMKHNRNYFEWGARLIPSSMSLRKARSTDAIRDRAQKRESQFKYKYVTNNIWQREMMEHKMRLGEDGLGFAVRSCIQMEDGNVRWATMLDSICRDKGSSDANELSLQLESQTSDPSNVDAAMFVTATYHMQEILPYALKDMKIAKRMVAVVSNLMAVNDSVIEEVNSNGTSTQKLVRIVNSYTNEAKIAPDVKNISINSNNLALEIMEIASEETGSHFLQGITYTTVHKLTRDKPNDNRFANETIVQPMEEDISINIPNEALLRATALPSKKARVYFVSYRNGNFFRAKSGRFQNASSNIPVLVASISNVTVENLTDVLAYSFPNVHHNREQICVYWSPEGQEWLQNGLTTNQTEDVVQCQSDHMTAFSVLLDPDPLQAISDHHKNILSIISYIGCVCSIVGLVFTILTYSIFRCLNRDRSGKILLNLCVSLVLMNFSFLLVAVKERVSYVNLCTAIAFLTHYFVLTSLAWMLVEAVNMYQLLVTVFATSETRFMLKRVICAWGLPLVIVSTTALYDINYYYSVETDYCVLAPTHPYIYYVSYLGPSCIILAINCVVFLLVSRILFQKKVAGKVGALVDNKITVAQVRGAFTVMTLLGVTWIFGAFAIGEAKVVFQYLFCVSNSVQGFIIFVVRCVQYSEVRMAWSTLLRTGKFKKYRGVLPTSSTRHTLSSSTLGSQATRNAALDNTIGSTPTLWSRLFHRRSSQKQKLHSYSNYSFRNTFGSGRLPNYIPKNAQKPSTISKDVCEMNLAPIDGVRMREMPRSLPSSHSSRSSKKNLQYATCIPRLEDKKRSFHGSCDAPPLATRAPLDAIRKAWSQESLDNKEGEDTSWQFMRVPMSKRKDNLGTKGAIKKVTPSNNGKVSTTYSADQGYMTAEHSPESPRPKPRHYHHQLGSTTNRLAKSTTEDLASSPEEPKQPPPSSSKLQVKKNADGGIGKSEIDFMHTKQDPDTRRDFEVSEALLLLEDRELYLDNPLMSVNCDREWLDKTDVQDGSRLRRVSFGNIECQLMNEINVPCLDHSPQRAKSLSSGDISGSNLSLDPGTEATLLCDDEMWDNLPFKKNTKRVTCNELI